MTPTSPGERPGLAGLRRLVARVPHLPVEEHPGPVVYSPVLVAYVGVLGAGAVAAAATVRTPADAALLVMGGCAVFLLAATAVRSLPGVSTYWSASIFAHLGLTLTAGPIGALVGVVAEAAGGETRLRNGWFRGLFNVSDQFLSSLTAWAVFHAITGGRTDLGAGVLAGLAAGAAAWVVNIGLLAGVQWLTHPGLRVTSYLGENAAAVLPYHLGAGFTAFGSVVLVRQEGAAGFVLLLAPVMLLQLSMLVLGSRTRAAQLQSESHARERELLLRQALEASDAERHRIARNLHDGVVQDLAAISVGLRSRGERGSGDAEATMLRAAEATAEAIDELRTLLREIAPPDLQEIGLTAALQELVEPLRGERIEVSLGIDGAAEEVRGPVLATVYRIAQEALRNVGEHSRAGHVRVEVRQREGRIDLEIADDGVGFSAERRHQQAVAGHLGLSLIHALARELGGELEIRSAPQHGTTLRAELPLDQAARRRTASGISS